MKNNYFVGVLLEASKNKDNRIEFADVWNRKTNDVSICYRVAAFDRKFDVKKARKISSGHYDTYTEEIEAAKAYMKENGISVPAVSVKCIDLD